MIVTDKKYPLEKLLVQRLDLMVQRMLGTDDNLVLIDGDEGQGKSNLAAGICYYVAHQTRRPLTMANVFFDLDKLVDFAINTKEQIIWWDEGALGGLATEWWKKNQMKFLKLLMISRKKKHFFVICIPKFFKLNEYIVVDRSICLLHVYSRGQIQKGRFFYYSKRAKEKLWYDWRGKRVRNYSKFYTFAGTFPQALDKYFVVDINAYEKEKDKAIMSLGKEQEERMSLDKFKLLKLQYLICKMSALSQEEKEEYFKVPIRTMQDWKLIPQKYPKLLNLMEERGTTNLQPTIHAITNI